MLTVAEHYGLGKHIDHLSPHNEVQAMRYIVIQEGIACLAPMFGRISCALFILAIIGNTHWIKRYLLWGVVGVQVIINTLTIIQIYAQCGSHVADLYDNNPAAKTQCQNPLVEMVLGFVQSGESLMLKSPARSVRVLMPMAAFNSLSDLALTILPAIIVWHLNMPRKIKIQLAVLLSLSLLYVGIYKQLVS